jgi:hypothetical protein
MAEELGKIEKPSVDSFKKGRKLFFVPVLYAGEGTPEDYVKLLNKYWEQVARQLDDLSLKLGAVTRIFHEMIDAGGETGLTAIKELDARSFGIIKTFIEKNAQLEALEDANILTEFMDWSRCLMIGLQNQGVMTKVYELYVEAGKKRNEEIKKKIDQTLKENEIGILMMRENHQVQFPADIQIFYVSPPALDEVKRWAREQENKSTKDDNQKGEAG